jgi:uncharacterized membrane protein YGL010W
MSNPSRLFGHRSVDDWIDLYEKSHQNSVNRNLHTVGIPLIAVSLPLFLLSPFLRGFWRLPVILFALGWICQFAGHACEGKPPEFFKDWRFLLVGTRWWLKEVAGWAD